MVEPARETQAVGEFYKKFILYFFKFILGPYTVERPGSPNRVQIAVHCFGASTNVGGCDAGWPSGSTRTTVFIDWIDQNMVA